MKDHEDVHHHEFGGFQAETFVEGALASDNSVLRQHAMLFAQQPNLVERDMLLSYSGSWSTVCGQAIINFFLSRGIARQTPGETYQKL